MNNKKNIDLRHGDCLEVLKTLPADSVDSIVTDPPYGLSFMGKKWDYDVPGTEIWAECLRVLKPGGHLLAFFGSRTYHRGVVRIEDAGFEIRDQIMWVYGSGFPKSLDVSKAIDRSRKEDAEPVRIVCRYLRAAMDSKGLKSRHLVENFDGCHPRLIDHWAARDTDSQPALPTWEQWLTLKQVLSLSDEMDPEVWRLNGRKGKPGDNWEKREVVGQRTVNGEEGTAGGYQNGIASIRGADVATRREIDITAPATPAASQWFGWGTALKPAHEPIVLARKPLTGTVAETVLEWGTGAMNIDGCRVEGVKGVPASLSTAGGLGWGTGGDMERKQQQNGRWPANFIHDGSEEATEPLGEAQRFFYCAKAGKKDRDEGLEDFALVDGGCFDGNADMANARKIGARPDLPVAKVRNNHPTVKPTALMAYLCRLVTPPGGVVLDPFMGSGSTGKGAMLEGFNFIGIEREAEYVEIAKARIEAAKK